MRAEVLICDHCQGVSPPRQLLGKDICVNANAHPYDQTKWIEIKGDVVNVMIDGNNKLIVLTNKTFCCFNHLIYFIEQYK